MSHYEVNPLAANQLWVPGANYSIDGEYPTPTQDELCDLWRDYTGSDAVEQPPNGIFGAMITPDKPPIGIISIDACEVLRNTNLDITRVQRSAEDLRDKPIKSIHRYGEGCTYEDNHTDIQVLAQVLMDGGHITPVENIDQIGAIMQRWRAMGAYVVANTSTLPGCEPGTIRFFGRFLPGAFDAILLPRNHNSNRSLPTKGDVAADLTLAIEQAAFGDKVPSTRLERDLAAIHIEDKPCHNSAFYESMDAIGATAYTVQPMYPSHHEADPRSVQAYTPLAAFHIADRILGLELEQPIDL